MNRKSVVGPSSPWMGIPSVSQNIWCVLILCLLSQGTGLARLWRSLTTRLTIHRFLSRCFSKPHICWEWRKWGYDVCLHQKSFADLCLTKDSPWGLHTKGFKLHLDKFFPEKLFGIVVQWNYSLNEKLLVIMPFPPCLDFQVSSLG